MVGLKKLFGGIDLTWKKVITFAVLAGVYTAIMAMIPAAKDTSFADITITFEVWILFGIIIIMNSKSPTDSALKCFVFFLISQPLVYLMQVPFTALRWQIFGYYKYWFIWTALTIPMGFVGFYMKRDKWWGLLILTPILVFLGFHFSGFVSLTRYWFPHHLLTAIFCLITLLIYPTFIFNHQKVKTAGIIISIVIILCSSGLALVNRNVYNTTVLVNGGSAGAVFDDSCTVYLDDAGYGDVRIVYDDNIEDYMVNAAFYKAGKTNLILEDANGDTTVYALEIGYSNYEINKQ